MSVNYKNLQKLADFLAEPPERVEQNFDMREFCANNLIRPSEVAGTNNHCGCAVGWAPIVEGLSAQNHLMWSGYCYETFGVSACSPAGKWMFGSHWMWIDNTPQGAARRINFFIRHGVPVNADRQRLGIDEYMFDVEKHERVAGRKPSSAY